MTLLHHTHISESLSSQMRKKRELWITLNTMPTCPSTPMSRPTHTHTNIHCMSGSSLHWSVQHLPTFYSSIDNILTKKRKMKTNILTTKVNQWSKKLACHIGTFSFTRGVDVIQHEENKTPRKVDDISFICSVCLRVGCVGLSTVFIVSVCPSFRQIH